MVRDTGLSVLDLFMLGAASGIMIGALGYSGAGFTLSVVLIHLAGGSLIGLLVLSGIANIVLGTGLPTVACYILLATLVAPTLIQMGIDPMAAHMFILYYGCLSAISPPVAIAAFIAANLAEADHNKTGWTAMAFGWTIFVIPFLFVFSPSLLLRGPWLLIGLNFITAIAGVWFIAAAGMGYSFRPLRWLDRLLYGAVGVFLLLPVEVSGLSQVAQYHRCMHRRGAAGVGACHLEKVRWDYRGAAAGGCRRPDDAERESSNSTATTVFLARLSGAVICGRRSPWRRCCRAGSSPCCARSSAARVRRRRRKSRRDAA